LRERRPYEAILVIAQRGRFRVTDPGGIPLFQAVAIVIVTRQRQRIFARSPPLPQMIDRHTMRDGADPRGQLRL
jgi:hypothetical protein